MVTITQNQNINLYSPAFKGEGEPPKGFYDALRKSISEVSIQEEERIQPKKVVNKVKKVNLEALKNAGKFMEALGKISAGFVWERLKNLGLFLIQWPVVLVAGLVLETGLTLMFSHNLKYKNGDYKYKLEQIDENAKKAESYYGKDVEKYYQETGKVIFDYASVIEQMEAEKQEIQRTIKLAQEKR